MYKVSTLASGLSASSNLPNSSSPRPNSDSEKNMRNLKYVIVQRKNGLKFAEGDRLMKQKQEGHLINKIPIYSRELAGSLGPV